MIYSVYDTNFSLREDPFFMAMLLDAYVKKLFMRHRRARCSRRVEELVQDHLHFARSPESFHL